MNVKIVSVYLPSEMKEKVRRRATEQGCISVSEYLRQIIVEKFAQDKIAEASP